MAVQLNPRTDHVNVDLTLQRPRRRFFSWRRVAVVGTLAALGYAGWRMVRPRPAGHAGYETAPTLPAERAVAPARPATVPIHGTPT